MAGNKMGEETREKILLAAEQEFLEKGYENSRVEEIAKRAGVTKVMLYYHFNTKQNIFNEFVKKMVCEIRSGFQESMSHLNLSNPEDFRAHLKAMLAFYQERQSLIRLVVSEQINNRNPEAKTLAIFSDIFQLILSLPGIDTGSQQEEFLTRVFFFNALPMVMYACLSDMFCEDFKVNREASLDVFIDSFARSFFQNVSAAHPTPPLLAE